MTIQITKAVIADIPELCVLLAQLFTQEAEFKPDQRAQTQGLEAIINGQDIGAILVARQSGAVIGMVNILYTISTALGGRVGLLEDMVVSPKCRGQGVGSQLLSHALEFAKSNGCRRITLLTDGSNASAQRFYQRHGFSCSAMTVFRAQLGEQ